MRLILFPAKLNSYMDENRVDSTHCAIFGGNYQCRFIGATYCFLSFISPFGADEDDYFLRSLLI